MNSEVYAEFSLTGLNLNPEDVTSKTGIQPTRTWLKDELISPKAQIRYQQSGWKLRSHLEASDDLSEHFHTVLEQLKQGWQPLVELCSIYEAEFCGVIYTSDDRPPIHFDRDILKAVLQLNAEIDIDLYVLPPEAMSVNEAKIAGLEDDVKPKSEKRHPTGKAVRAVVPVQMTQKVEER